MNLKSKKRLAAKILKIGNTRVWVDPNNRDSLKEAITRSDIKKLIRDGVILVKQKKGVSRGRVRKILLQKRKGRRSGAGSRKGKFTARSGKKILWVRQIRLYRSLFNQLMEKKLITNQTYSHLRKKAKGGYFRNRRHVLLYLNENNL